MVRQAQHDSKIFSFKDAVHKMSVMLFGDDCVQQIYKTCQNF